MTEDPVRPEAYIGLISGTSRDGLDAAVLRFPNGDADLLHASCVPYPPALRRSLDHLIDQRRRPDPAETHDIDRELGRFFAGVCADLWQAAGLKKSAIAAIGSHGQTIWHEPSGPDPISLQLGHAQTLANLTGLTVVSDFRRADLRAGGHGAPLAPLLHRELFGHGPLIALNLGGIANLTIIDHAGAVSGFDTGPANCLMDHWILSRKSEPFDASGRWAASGTVDEPLLARLLEDPYFSAPAPKSTGLETFNADWLYRSLDDSGLAQEVVQRTLLELTVESIARALDQCNAAGDLLVCGGGVHNHFLMERLAKRLAPRTVNSTATRGIDPDWVEATLFAWLARERLLEHAQDTSGITGAKHPVKLGVITPTGVTST